MTNISHNDHEDFRKLILSLDIPALCMLSKDILDEISRRTKLLGFIPATKPRENTLSDLREDLPF